MVSIGYKCCICGVDVGLNCLIVKGQIYCMKHIPVDKVKDSIQQFKNKNSLKNLDQRITDIYTLKCLPCLALNKANCKVCETMGQFTKLQEQKKKLEEGD
jgi:hypothetical protein